MAPITLRVEVTAEDIRDGRRTSCYRCPIAAAANRALKAAGIAGEANVVSRELHIVDEVARFTHHAGLPAEATAFVLAFDAREMVHPIAFSVTLEPIEVAA